MKRQRRSSRPRTSSPQRKSQSLVRRRSARGNRSISRSRSMSPVRASNSMRLARLSLDSGEQNRAGSPQPVSTTYGNGDSQQVEAQGTLFTSLVFILVISVPLIMGFSLHVYLLTMLTIFKLILQPSVCRKFGFGCGMYQRYIKGTWVMFIMYTFPHAKQPKRHLKSRGPRVI